MNFKSILFLSIFLLFSTISISQTNCKSKIETINGLTLGLHSEDYNYSYNKLLKEVENTGAAWVSLVPKFYQQNIKSDSIYTLRNEPLFWKQLKQTIEQAHANNLKVMLFPIVLLIDAKENEWRGKLNANNIDLWFKNYETNILKLAKFCEELNVEMLSVGSEFNSLESKTKHWKTLIANVRKNYNGKITYSVNWDSIEGENFFEDLDALGISGYFSLTDKKNPTVNELTLGWKKHQAALKNIFEFSDIPYYFSEIGYTSLNGTNTNPWNRNISDKLDFNEQADCFTAFKNVWKNDQNFSGVFFYDWFGFGGKEDDTFCIRKKPASKVIEKYFE